MSSEIFEIKSKENSFKGEQAHKGRCGRQPIGWLKPTECDCGWVGEIRLALARARVWTSLSDYLKVAADYPLNVEPRT
ncbi:MAG: hypothetical protein H0M93_04940 [Methanophagales archaeon]|nr:hypothetical protein [Methanophagales archaeon]